MVALWYIQESGLHQPTHFSCVQGVWLLGNSKPEITCCHLPVQRDKLHLTPINWACNQFIKLLYLYTYP